MICIYISNNVWLIVQGKYSSMVVTVDLKYKMIESYQQDDVTSRQLMVVERNTQIVDLGLVFSEFMRRKHKSTGIGAANVENTNVNYDCKKYGVTRAALITNHLIYIHTTNNSTACQIYTLIFCRVSLYNMTMNMYSFSYYSGYAFNICSIDCNGNGCYQIKYHCLNNSNSLNLITLIIIEISIFFVQIEYFEDASGDIDLNIESATVFDDDSGDMTSSDLTADKGSTGILHLHLCFDSAKETKKKVS